MKIRSVGALAGLCMLLTSYSVWSLTGEGPGRDAPKPTRERSERRDTTELAAGDKSSFSIGRTLRAEGRIGHTRLSGDSDSETYLLVTVRADAQATGPAARRHLSIVLDRSGSMQGKRLRNAVAAAQSAVRRLGNEDVVSVIDYSTNARVLVPPTELDSRTRDRVVNELARVTAEGDTCISCGLESSVELIGRRTGYINRVLLLSDGEATAGILDADGLRRVAASVRNANASVTTIGVDVDYNERLMTAIAQESSGRHYFVENPEGLARIFDLELSGLERTVARDAELGFELAPGIELIDVADRSFRREGSRVLVTLGTFAAGEERSVLVRVRVPRGAAGDRPVATTRLRFDDLTTGSAASSEGTLAALLTDDGSRSPLDPIVEERVQRSGTVGALTDANDLFAAGDADGARTRVKKELAAVRSSRAAAVAAAPAPKKAAVEKDFDRQEAALGAAATAFAEPPPSPGAAPEEERKGKAVLKRNQAEAFELGL
jgi:Ca-activated chloride channel family protein